MKKIIAFLIAVSSAFCAALTPSPVPPAALFYIDLEPGRCGSWCLDGLIKDELFASFLAKYDKSVANSEQTALYASLMAGYMMKSGEQPEFKIAVILPQKVIKGYTQVITNALFAYAIRRELSVKMDFFYTGDESDGAINSALDQMRMAGHKYAIAAVTAAGIAPLRAAGDLQFFVPTANDEPASNAVLSGDGAGNIIFGGIDYDAQIEALMAKSSGKIAVFSDDSALSQLITKKVLNADPSAYAKSISGDNIDFKAIFENNNKLLKASVFLNMPLVKTALVASQLRVYDREPHTLLSTQINFSGALISLTQPEDRKRLLVANSIAPSDDALVAASEMFGSSIVFDWVAYASALGFDRLYTSFIDDSAAPLFSEEIRGSQVRYPVRIMAGTKSGFVSEDEL